ncbi:MAG: methyltransferase domain-containing protein [Actinomycetota bacterium]
MRIITRRIAGLEHGSWDREAEALVTRTFDTLAPEWHTRTSPERTAIVHDALSRGLDPLLGGSGLCVEVGSGIGTYTPLLESRFDVLLTVELSWQMLARAPETGRKVQADGGRLPVRDGAADAVVLINAFLFPAEVARALHVGGVLLWVNSSGDQTPIYLSTADVVSALPFPVRGVESRAGAGAWCALVKTHDSATSS